MPLGCHAAGRRAGCGPGRSRCRPRRCSRGRRRRASRRSAPSARRLGGRARRGGRRARGPGPTAARSPAMVAAIWMFIPGYPALPENRPGSALQSQTGHTVPSTSCVPRRPAISAGCGHAILEHLPDQRPEQVPAPGDGGLADAEDGPGDLLCDVLAHQRDHHRHRPEQADGGRSAAGPHHVPGPPQYPQRQLVQLLIAQSGENLVPQRLLREIRALSLRYSWQEPFCYATTGT